MTPIVDKLRALEKEIVTPRAIAELFCDLDDEKQAQFFIECGEIMKTWKGGGRPLQACLIGSHLRTCACSTFEARELVREIAEAIEHGEHT